MGFHFCAHSWEVRTIDDGTLVRLSPRDLDAGTLPHFVEDLFELVLESGQPDLYLDFAELRQASSEVREKLTALGGKMRTQGGRLILLNVKPFIYESMQASGVTNAIDVRVEESGDTIF